MSAEHLFAWRRTFILFVISVLARAALGSGTVTNFTQSALQTALAGGGTVLFAGNGTITLTNTLIISSDTAIDSSSNAVIISGGNGVRLFQVASNVNFQLKGLTLADGRVIGTNGLDGHPATPGQDVGGAAILNLGGNLALNGCTLTNHYLQGGSGGSDFTTSTNGNGARGGNAIGAAICNLGGELNLTNCLIVGNAAIGGNGGSSTGILGSPPGEGGRAFGAALYCENAGSGLEQLTFASNSVSGGSPGQTASGFGNGGAAAAGALYASNSVILLEKSVLAQNSAVGGGPLMSPDSLSTGFGSGDGLGGALFISSGSSATVKLCSFETNSTMGGIGGTLFTCGAGRGGGVFNAGGLQVWNSTFSGGLSVGGSANLNPPGGSASAGQGGGICSIGSLSVNASTFDGNTAIGGSVSGTGADGSPSGAGEGGAVWSSSQLWMTNSTITANRGIGGGNSYVRSPGGPGNGGGIALTGGTASLVNITVAANRADGTNNIHGNNAGPALGGNVAVSNATVMVLNSIIADNGNGGDVWGSVTDGGYNICSDGTANFSAPGSLNQADPMLAALSNNGGPTATMALLAASPARDAIPSGFPPTDQRGVTRPQGTAADIGAFEADFISAAPAIVTQPQGTTVRAGTNYTLTVGASGTQPLFYQWLKNSNAIAGATSPTLALTDLQAADAGIYSAVVTNAFGSATSQGAVLVVDSKPRILTQAVSVLISPGATTNFNILADGPLLSYQWWHGGLTVPGATNSNLVISNALAGAQGNYLVVVSNFAGSVTSAVATLSFDASALSILVPPKNATAEAGYSASFNVLVSGIPPFAYQWEQNGTPLAGATNSSLTLQSVRTNDAGAYAVVVTNDYASLTSSAAQLTVTPGALPPQLALGRLANNLTITFSAEAGRTYRLLSSTNLAVWSAVDTNSVVLAGPVQFVQPITSSPRSFYRVITP